MNVDSAVAIEIDRAVVTALETDDMSALRVMGNGEFSVVLGWPSSAPTLVVKPIGPFRPEEYLAYESLLHDYIAELRRRGVATVDTQITAVERQPGTIVGYMFQPLLESESLAENALTERVPLVDDPILDSIVSALMTCDADVSIDPPVSNWYWDGSRVALLDVGLPLMWGDQNSRRLDFAPFMRSLPIGARTLFRRGFESGTDRMRERRKLGIEFVSRLAFFDLDEWEGVALDAFNLRLDSADRISFEEVEAMRHSDSADLKRFKRLQRRQRRWVQGVLRRRYEFCLGESTY